MTILKKINFQAKSSNPTILLGFENEYFEKALSKEMNKAGKEPTFHARHTKESILIFLEQNKECTTVILTEQIGNQKFTAEELKQLVANKKINLIVIISSNWKGTEYVNTLYSAKITGAVFQEGRYGASPQEVAKLVLHERSLKEAKIYYGIDPQ